MHLVNKPIFQLIFLFCCYGAITSVFASNHTTGSKNKHPNNINNLETFREGHSVAFITKAARTSWRASGKIISPQTKFPKQAYGLKLRYTYQIHWYKQLGGYLGSELGYSRDNNINNQTSTVSSSGKLLLPGLLFGFSYTPSPQIRISFGSSFYMERYLNLEMKEGILAITMNVLGNFELNFEYFYYDTWAFYLSVSQENSSYKKLQIE